MLLKTKNTVPDSGPAQQAKGWGMLEQITIALAVIVVIALVL